jgi:hypothetical protein
LRYGFSIVALVILVIACSSVDQPAATPTPVFNVQPTPRPDQLPLGPDAALTVAAGRASVAATAAARATPTPQEARVLSAAVAAIRGADCSRPGGGLPAPSTPCVSFVQASLAGTFNRGPRTVYFVPPQDLDRGLALFKADLPGDDRDYYVLLASNASGEWLPVGAFVNAPAYPVQLPWEPVACARDGGRTLVFTEIGGVVRDGVVRGMTMKAERFVLTAPGSATVDGGVGYGYFRITSPVDGWVDSRDIEVVRQTRCTP